MNPLYWIIPLSGFIGSFLMLCVLSLCKMAGDGEGYTITCNTKCQKLIYDADTLQDANKQAAELRSWGYDVTIKSNSEAKS